jgi:hypothetical protein
MGAVGIVVIGTAVRDGIVVIGLASPNRFWPLIVIVVVRVIAVDRLIQFLLEIPDFAMQLSKPVFLHVACIFDIDHDTYQHANHEEHK